MCLLTQQRVFVSRDYPEMMGFLPELIEVVRRLKIDPKVSSRVDSSAYALLL